MEGHLLAGAVTQLAQECRTPCEVPAASLSFYLPSVQELSVLLDPCDKFHGPVQTQLLLLLAVLRGLDRSRRPLLASTAIAHPSLLRGREGNEKDGVACGDAAPSPPDAAHPNS